VTGDRVLHLCAVFDTVLSVKVQGDGRQELKKESRKEWVLGSEPLEATISTCVPCPWPVFNEPRGLQLSFLIAQRRLYSLPSS